MTKIKIGSFPGRVLTALTILAWLSLTACGGGGSAGEPGTANPSLNPDDDPPTDPETDPTPEPEPDPPQVTDIIPLEDLTIIPTEEARPFRANSPYADVLKECALINFQTPCALSTLPFIGHDTNNPTVEDILNRTLVTHDWMGVRLGELLEALPADMLSLFRPITSVIIGSEVRPSSYSPSRARMKIDAAHLWLTVEEKKTISREDDYRTNFGADLQFVAFWRFMQGDNYAIPYSNIEDYSERSLDDILLRAARPLYHELAHANDFIRADDIPMMSLDLSPGNVADINVNTGVSTRLYEDLSLTDIDSELYGLARVRYADEPPTEDQKSILADYAGSVMGEEGKSRFYGYYTIYEDTASLFEQFMMKYHFGAETHTAFLTKPENYPDAECAEYIVAWGSRNRIAAPLVLPRAKWVVEQILGPSADLDTFVAGGVGDDKPLRVGDDWCSSRFENPTAVSAGRSSSDIDDNAMLRFERQLYRGH